MRILPLNSIYRCVFSILLFLVLLISCTQNTHLKQRIKRNRIDSLLTTASNNNAQSNIILKEAFTITESLHNDSLELLYKNKIALLTAERMDTVNFPYIGKSTLALAYKLKDTFALGNAHWNYGVYYLKKEILDSSYSHYKKALQYFHLISHDYYAGKMLYNMGFIRSRIKDYTGSEILLFQAIELFHKTAKNKQLYLSYNLLGALNDDLKEFDQALIYYKTALDYLNNVEDKFLYLQDTQNNMGLIYQQLERYDEAIALFNKALEEKNVYSADPALYARLIDNLAYCKLLANKQEDVSFNLLEALRIRDSLHNTAGVVMSNLHLAAYYLQKADSSKANLYALKGYNLGVKGQLNRDILDGLLLLSKINPSQQINYLNQYINLNRTLYERERHIRNKFTRIHYETDRYIARNKQLWRQGILILIGSLGVILIFVLLFINARQRVKNKSLEFETQQQKANEKIYLLTLKQKANLEKGRFQERKRISEELHDGILAKLFGIRINWEFLKLKGDTPVLEKHNYYLKTLQEVEKEIRDISHDLKAELFRSGSQFINTIEMLLKQWAKNGSLKYIFSSDSNIDWEHINDFTKANIYRIVEEALQNCVKHANAKQIELSFKKMNNSLEIHIIDNGKGFIKISKHSGIGIKNMRSRAQKLQGHFSISGQGGTHIYIKIPLQYST